MFRSRRLTIAVGVVVAALAATVLGGTAASAAPSAAAANPAASTVIAQILKETNAIRAEVGKPALKSDAKLQDVAMRWSGRQAAESTMYHNPNLTKDIPSGWTRAGENVAVGYSYTRVTTAWKESPGHYKNMVGDYNYIGIGVAYDGSRPYYTQVFGKYASAPSPVVDPDDRYAPSGAITSVSLAPGKITVKGWASDKDSSAAATVGIYVDGYQVGRIKADGSGDAFSTTFSVSKGGTRKVCATVANMGGSSHRAASLPCQSVQVPVASPIGLLQSVTASSSKIRVQGWAIDANTTSPLTLWVSVDGRIVAKPSTTLARSDVARKYPAWDSNTGFNHLFSASRGTHKVCVTAVNVGAGGNAQLQGSCKTVRVG